MFTLVAVSWTMRAAFPSVWEWHGGFFLVVWYQYVGWAAVDNAVFAVVQAGLLWAATRKWLEEDGGSDETEPLLHT